ncbi:ethylene-dependent gravitropism-deficient and yellow-green-like 2 [Wolffia australiana]
MNLPASAFRGGFPSSSLARGHLQLHHLRPARFPANSDLSAASIWRCSPFCTRLRPRDFTRSPLFSRRDLLCRATPQTDPDGKNGEDTSARSDGEPLNSVSGEAQESGSTDTQSNAEQPTREDLPFSALKQEISNIDTTPEIETKTGRDDNTEVIGGSPFPGMKQLGESIRIPKATIDALKDQVFGFDTFFVTSQEPYERGVLFKGNLRGQAGKAYEKITRRIQDRFGDQYKVFLLINPEDDKPVAVVVPRQTLQPESTAVPEWFAAGAFGLVTVFTLLLRNVPSLQSNLLSTFDNFGLLTDGVPGALVTAAIIGVHEIGHILVAREAGIKLGVSYFVPSWQIGSFGAITRILNIVPNREKLLNLAAAGPLAGFSLGMLLLLAGFILPPSDGLGIIIDPDILHESFLVGGLAKLILGDVLKEGSQLSINPLLLWAWAGLLINAINSIPAGELDGGRIAFALWGRKISSRITSVALALLGISSLFNDVAFYWVVLIFFLQRGPISPLSDEISEPEDKYKALGLAVLVLCLLVCLPYPFPFAPQELTIDF